MATISIKAFMHTNRELCTDVTTHLLGDRRLQEGKGYYGILRRMKACEENGWRDDLLDFTQLGKPHAHRNPHVFLGRLITITRQADGSLRPNFRPMPEGAEENPAAYAMEVAEELMLALSLVEKRRQAA